MASAEDLAASAGVTLLRFDHLRDPLLFADGVRLSRAGATHYTRLVTRALDTTLQALSPA